MTCMVKVQLISAFVLATCIKIVKYLFFINLKFQASSHLLWLYRQFCVGNTEDWFSCDIAQIYEHVMRKPFFCICENKDADQLISAFVFATRIVQPLNFLNTKFQASSHLVWSYSLVCDGPGRKPQRPVFSQRGSYMSGTCSREIIKLCRRKALISLGVQFV